jgi:parallel beta-helix repeat protein
MVRLCLHLFILIALFLFLVCPDVVQAGDLVTRSDAPYAGGYGADTSCMFNRSDESDPSTHVVINEIEQNPAGFDGGNEWVELYNPTTSDVNLDGWRLSTTHGKTVTVTLHGTIPANGYFVYTHAEQWLDNEDESVTLRDPSLNEIDRTSYLTEPYRIDNGYYSWQRYPNGNDTGSDSDWMFRASTKGYGSCGELPPPKTIYVDDDFVDDPPNHRWNTIQEGINDASDGATIIVSDGIYRENVGVYKRLTIRSENGADATIVQAASSLESVFCVTTDHVNINGFMMTGTEYPGTGIYLYGADHCNISCNNVSNNGDGICLSSSSNNTLRSNTASDNSRIGVGMWDSNNNILQNNTANSNNLYGIYLQSSSNYNTLENNTVNSNGSPGISIGSSSNNTLTSNTANLNNYCGIGVDGSDKSDYNNFIDITNTVNDKPVYYFFDKNGIVLDGLDAGHLTLAHCSDCTIKNSNVSNGDGIYLVYSSNNTLTGNTANSNTCNGISIGYSSNNTLTSNLMSNNTYNFRLYGWNDSYFDNNIDTTNLVDGKSVYYVKNTNGVTFDFNTQADVGTIYCIQCNNITIKDATLTNNGVGVFFWKTNNSRIENVNASNNNDGIAIYYSLPSSVTTSGTPAPKETTTATMLVATTTQMALETPPTQFQ